jgi:hypothetical protein
VQLVSHCCNPSLRVVTKAKELVRLWAKRKPGNVGKFEGMNLHTPKITPTLGVGVLVDFRIFRGRLQGSKLIIGKILECSCPKWAHMTHLDIWNTSYGQKKGPGQNGIWMWASWRGTKYIIMGKVMVSPKSKLWWVLWIRVCPWLVLAPKVLQLCTNQLVVWFCADPCEWLSVCHSP